MDATELKFVIPSHPEDLFLTGENFYIEDEVNINALSDAALEKLLDGVEKRLKKHDATKIVLHENFDPIFSLLYKFSSTNGQIAAPRVFEILKTGFSSVITSTGELLSSNENRSSEEYNSLLFTHRNALRMYMFLIHWIVSLASKKPVAGSSIVTETTTTKKGKKGKSTETNVGIGWETESQKEKLFSSMVNALELDLQKLWRANPEEDFVNLFSKCAYLAMEDGSTKSKAIKRCIFIMLCTLIKTYEQSSGILNSLIHLMHNIEHVAPVFAEFCEVLVNEYHAEDTVSNLIREISRTNAKETARDSSGMKNIATFLSELSWRLPKHVLANLPILLPHLDGESYTLRNGIVQTLGNLIVRGFAGHSDEGPVATHDTRDSLFDVLEERFRDVNSYTRSKVIQTWILLVKEKCTPLSRWNSVTALTVDRLRDKAAQTRKNALQLLTTLLQYNPFSPSLPLFEFTSKLDQLQATIEANAERDTNKENQPATNIHDGDATMEEKQRFLQRFFTEAVTFINLIHSAVPVACQLLGSKNHSDVLEGVKFFVVAKTFNIQNSTEGIRKMLMLVWSKEAAIKEEVINAYKELYLSPPKDDPVKIAKNLISLTVKASLGELTSLEEMITEMMKQQLIRPNVVQILWDIVAMKQQGNGIADSRGALIILSMIANGDSDIVRKNLNLLVQVGLGSRWKEDEYLAKYTCIALQKLAKKGSGEDKGQSARFKPTHPLFQKLAELIKDRSISQATWYGAAEQAINAIYVLCEKPDQLCAAIIKEFAGYLFPGLAQDGNPQRTEEEVANTPVSDLSKFLFILGHVALKQLVHIETIQNELRRRRGQEKSDEKKKPLTAIEEELGVANAAEEHEVELLQEMAEKEIVSKNLLGTFGPLIALIAANAGNKFNDHALRTSAVLALCKYMCVNADFCDKHLQLLFTILQTAPESAIRANIVISLGDLAFRFPNIIEPWTAEIYSRLRDQDPRVRKTTLMVLAHLILNDMIKIKGQISEMAICLEDEDTRISDLARLFFHELSQKGNVIYNILPDLISSLSTSKNFSATAFRNTMKFLFSYIEKDRQAESLVEKLCHRFQTTGELEQWRNIAYCLALLNYNDRAVRKLNELSKCYKDPLNDDEVHSSFVVIINKARKFAKADIKEVLAELESKVHATPTDGGGEEENEEGVPPVRGETQDQPTKERPQARRGGRRPGRTKAPAKTAPKKGRNSKKKNTYQDSDEDEEDARSFSEESSEEDEDEEESEPPKPKQPEPMDLSEEEEPKPKKAAPKKKAPTRKKASRRIVDSSEDEE